MNEYGLPNEVDMYFDIASGLKRLGGNKKIYARMLGMLINSKEFEAFNTAIDEGNLPSAAEHAHAIKGMSGNLSVSKMYEISSILNEELNNGIKTSSHVEALKEATAKSLEYAKIIQAEFSK